MSNNLAHYKLLPGYAERSTRRRPKCPETVMVTETDCAAVHCVGSAVIDGSSAWLCFKVPGRREYFFQYRPW